MSRTCFTRNDSELKAFGKYLIQRKGFCKANLSLKVTSVTSTQPRNYFKTRVSKDVQNCRCLLRGKMTLPMGSASFNRLFSFELAFPRRSLIYFLNQQLFFRYRKSLVQGASYTLIFTLFSLDIISVLITDLS